MKLSEFKNKLGSLQSLNIVLKKPAPFQSTFIPAHFHITEIGLNTKYFIDCGGDVHAEKFINLQIWVADDFNHRLSPASLLKIIDLSGKVLGNEDLDIEVEYQTDTLGKYYLEFQSGNFFLIPKQADCLAKIKCNIQTKSCTPGGKCC